MNSPAIGSDLKGDVPVCIGSGNGDVSVEGLRQWHDTNQPVGRHLSIRSRFMRWTVSCH